MTCIVGIVHGDRVLIGGDSAGVNGSWASTVRADQKVWAADGWAFGFTSSFRFGQILRWQTKPPPVEDRDLEEYMATVYVDHIRGTLKDAGWLKTENGRDDGGTFLIGHKGRLFAVHDDFQVAESIDGFDAVGSAAQEARGALYAAPKGLAPRQKVTLALEAAAHLNAAVRGPFHIVEAR